MKPLRSSAFTGTGPVIDSMKIIRKVTHKKAGRIKGETDVKNKVVTIHKGAHKGPKTQFGNRIINTILHEEHHAKHPKATEKETYKAANAKERTIAPKTKKKLYAKYQKSTPKAKAKKN